MSEFPTTHAHLEVQALSCERGDRLLFQDLTFRVGTGETLLVEGANGSGKTTLLRTLCGLRAPSAGRVCWRGEDIGHIRPEFHADLNYIGHLPGIKDDLTAVENLRVACALQGARADVDLMEVLDKVGLFGFEDLPCRHLSAGQRRRVALARLWALDTRLWILDEPFNAIDRKGVDLLKGVLESHLATGGSIVLTTHQRIEVGQDRLQRLNLSDAEAL